MVNNIQGNITLIEQILSKPIIGTPSEKCKLDLTTFKTWISLYKYFLRQISLTEINGNK